MNKLELLENFDKANNGTYKLDDLAELIVEAYELGCDTEYEKIKRVCELAEKFLQEPDDEMVNYHLAARRILIALDGEE